MSTRNLTPPESREICEKTQWCGGCRDWRRRSSQRSSWAPLSPFPPPPCRERKLVMPEQCDLFWRHSFLLIMKRKLAYIFSYISIEGKPVIPEQCDFFYDTLFFWLRIESYCKFSLISTERKLVIPMQYDLSDNTPFFWLRIESYCTFSLIYI